MFPLNCRMFVISLYFKGIEGFLGATLENFDFIALQPNLLSRAQSIIVCALCNQIERFKKQFCNTTLAGWVLSYLNRSLLRQGDLGWSALQQQTIQTKGIRVLKDITKAINANTVSGWECARLAKAGGEQWCYLSTLWCSPTGVAHWFNVNKQVNDSRKAGKKWCQLSEIFMKVEVVPRVTFASVSMWPELLSNVPWFALKRHSSFSSARHENMF